jgi:DNA-binding IclR family transcriptional regulator
MSFTYEELHKKTLAQLREIAKDIEHDAVHGFTQMNKEHLLPAICTALGIEAHEHHQVVGLDKTGIKTQIKKLKAERDQAIQAHDRKELKALRRRIHHLKRRIHAATV